MAGQVKCIFSGKTRISAAVLVGGCMGEGEEIKPTYPAVPGVGNFTAQLKDGTKLHLQNRDNHL